MTLVQTVRVQVTLNPAATTPSGKFMNTWHIASRDATTPLDAVDDFITDLNAFYQAVDTYLNNDMNASVPLVQAYNLLEVKPRQPIRETTLTALTTGNGKVPQEVCACVSYRSIYESGVSPKRRRGRIYLGPLYGSAVDSTTGLLAAAMVTAIKNAADSLQQLSAASSTYAWVVYSPTSDPTGTGETGMHEVTEGWVDNLPDIQRRRGVQVGTKSTF